MSRSLHDQFIDDDEEETCPLCVEEFDLTDKGFKPCPCGYQICQFCYHNVKNNMNGLCPACRRPYNDRDIEYKPITAEQSAAHKARQAQKQKKTQAALQKEKQKAEADHLSRKHLAGLRVVQKNLVYVTGLAPTTQEDQLLQTLRGDQYFGQYGEIVKIVVSKAKDTSHPHSVGVYVTYKHKEDAATCIASVDGSKNGERTLRAQYGTTKYCTIYLRGENCQNRSCMFLHEPGEASDSYSRADLSALNAGGSQHGSTRLPPPQSQQPVASATQDMTRQPSDQAHGSPSEGPALPSHASWASKPAQQLSGVGSRAASVAQDSPAPTHVVPATQTEPPQETQSAVTADTTLSSATKKTRTQKQHDDDPFLNLVRDFNINDLRFAFSTASLSQADIDLINNYPPLFDPNGGARRRLRRQREEEQRRMEQEAQPFQTLPTISQEENSEMSGSLQLGGEPEERQNPSQPQSAIQPPGHDPTGLLDQRFQFGGLANPGIGDRGTLSQQHQQLLQTMKTPSTQTPGNQLQALQQQLPNNPPGHQRNTSRYSFANDTSASTSVKPVASAKLLSQQSSMMPSTAGGHFGGHQSHGNQFFTSNVQGPPPGLKATGTPPVSGGMTFGQGHGFATGGIHYGANALGRNANEEMMRNLLRGRDAGNIGPSADGAKPNPDHLPGVTDLPYRSNHERRTTLDVNNSRHPTPPVPPGFEEQAARTSRRSTPNVPPGLGKSTTIPTDIDAAAISRPNSSTSLRRVTSHVLPAVPLRPATPVRQTPPTQNKSDPKGNNVLETPTKAPKRSVVKLEATTKSEPVKQMQVETLPNKTTSVANPQNSIDSAIPAKNKDAQPVPPATGRGRKKTTTIFAQVETEVQPALMTETKIEPNTIISDSTRKELPVRKATDKPVSTSSAATSKETSSPQPVDSVDSGNPSRRVSHRTSAKTESTPPQASSVTVKPAPRTLRVLPAAKIEIPESATASALGPAKTSASRQASMTSTNTPGTPISEQTSTYDNVSVTSTSQSRASSPPPTSVSRSTSATTKTKSKSQLKKERQERAKTIEEEKSQSTPPESTKASEESQTQEAIVSRKKKTRKEKEATGRSKIGNGETGGDSTPTASQPGTPGRKATPDLGKDSPAVNTTKTGGAITPKKPSSSPQLRSTLPKAKDSSASGHHASAAQILSEIRAGSDEISKSLDSFFRSAAHCLKHIPSITAEDVQDPNNWKTSLKLSLVKEDVDKLLNGHIQAIKYGGADGRVWSRGMVTQSGAHIRALTDELEARFLELEQQICDLPEVLRFHPTKPQNDTPFPVVELFGVKRQLDGAPAARGVSVMEQMIQDGAAIKKGAFLVDEASKYLNEFVMPPATPPPPPPPPAATNAATNGSQAGPQGGANAASHVTPMSVDFAERAMNEARRVAEEREVALRKVLKKNRKLLGLA